jgi:hypothetical protein
VVGVVKEKKHVLWMFANLLFGFYFYRKFFTQVLTEIGKCLDGFTSLQFNAVITTLDTTPLSKMKTESGRPIAWNFLTPLSIAEAYQLFPKANSVPQLRQCISDCNGHPRSLETLKLVCEELNWQFPSYSTLLTKLLAGLENRGVPIPTLEIVKIALRGKWMNLDKHLDDYLYNEKVTLRDCIRMGHLLNSYQGDQTMVVPKLSPLLLMSFASRNFADSGECGEIARAIQALGFRAKFHFTKL